jgi:hypothetical protein
MGGQQAQSSEDRFGDRLMQPTINDFKVYKRTQKRKVAISFLPKKMTTRRITFSSSFVMAALAG